MSPDIAKCTLRVKLLLVENHGFKGLKGFLGVRSCICKFGAWEVMGEEFIYICPSFLLSLHSSLHPTFHPSTHILALARHLLCPMV